MRHLTSCCIGVFAAAATSLATWIGTPIFEGAEETTLPMTSFEGHEYPRAWGHWADFNQDGFMDLLTYLDPSNDGVIDDHLAIYLNVGGESLTEVWSISESAIAGYANDWQPIDFNGDGFPDLVNHSSKKIIYNNLGPNYACSSDLNKNGATEVLDLLFIIDRWGECGGT